MHCPRLIRGLRIAGTVGCGILCVLLVALWDRSHWWQDNAVIKFSPALGLRVLSLGGRIDLEGFRIRQGSVPSKLTSKGPIPDHVTHLFVGRPSFRIISYGTSFGTSIGIAAPHWFLLLLCAAFAVVPWNHWKWNFSLRTLLIATTLIAVVLGLAVWGMNS
jgi:hypothetical protein